MTIQKTVLFGLTFLTLIPAASAQCRRSTGPGTTTLGPEYHTVGYQTFLTARKQAPVHDNTSVLQPATKPGSCQAGHCSRMTDLAGRFELLTHEACLDLYHNYSHEPQFQATYGDVYRVFRIARQLHATPDIPEQALQQQLAEADGLLHHIQNTVTSMSAARRRQVGIYDMNARLEQVEIVLHQLLENAGVTLNSGLEEPPAPESLGGAPEPPLAPAEPLAIAPEPPVAPPAPANTGQPLAPAATGDVSFTPEAPAAAGVN